MTFVSSTKDTESLTLTLVTEFAAEPARVWQVWEDPRQLERWWGPPTWPATFATHDFTPGGRCHYFMTGPEGERAHGWWRFIAIDDDAPLIAATPNNVHAVKRVAPPAMAPGDPSREDGAWAGASCVVGGL